MVPVLHLSLPVRDLAATREFYVGALGCRPGRVHAAWCDVWFFGMQLTLQVRPDEVDPVDPDRARHFGVTLGRTDYEALVERLERHAVAWLVTPMRHAGNELSAKTGCKLADPSGNVIEIKHYPADSNFWMYGGPRWASTAAGQAPGRDSDGDVSG